MEKAYLISIAFGILAFFKRVHPTPFVQNVFDYVLMLLLPFFLPSFSNNPLNSPPPPSSSKRRQIQKEKKKK